jgi:hypothetical protein
MEPDMKTEEDEAFEAIERRQGGFQTKRQMAADKQRDCVHGKLARSCQICDLEAEVEELKAALAYIAPPKREWVGLTDKEIAQGNKESWVTEQAWQSAVWWAEAKLKEKNT